MAYNNSNNSSSSGSNNNNRPFNFPFQQNHHDRNPNPFPQDYDNDGRSSNGDTVVDDRFEQTEAIDLADLSKSVHDRHNSTDKKGKEILEEDAAVLDQEDPDAIYAHLPEHEQVILKTQVQVPEINGGVVLLYSYASRFDAFLLILSTICSIANGTALPLMTVIFGGLQKTFSDFTVGKIDANGLEDQLGHFVLYFVYLAVGTFVVTYIATVGFIYTGENITARIRSKYLESCLRQNIGFFDKVGAGEIVTRITSDTNLIQDGISEKVSSTISALSTFITAFIVAFINNPKLTGILSCVIVALVLNSSLFSSYILKNTVASITSAGNGADLAEEVLSSIRNAVAFGTQDRLAKKFDHHMSVAEYYGFRTKAAIGVMVGGMMLLLYMSYALAFWQGSAFLLNGQMELSEVLVVMMSVTTGAFNMGNISPNFQAFAAALAAANKVFNTIYRQSPIDPFVDEGDTIEDLQGHIRLENIRHIYPSRPGVVVMDGVSLDVPAGQTTALVGASGSGKSTIVGLVERFYSPVAGTVYLDGRDITTLNLRWLRQQMALVSQEPTLFATTILENIRFGLIGSKYEGSNKRMEKELVIAAAKKANAHDFIVALPEGYETNVGERGFLLSGGQKQRIAIARAVVSDPKILLLDEATSALDTKSEGVVQQALEKASEGRTTITIAHRLSTIRDAHQIVVMSVGRIIEIGTHDSLVNSRGAYYELVSAQQIKKTDDIQEEKQRAIDRAQNMHILRRSQFIAGNLFTGLEEEFDHKLTFTATEYLYNAARAEEPKAKYPIITLLGFVFSFNRTEWKRMSLGLFFSILCGGGNPVSAVLLAKEIVTLTGAATPGADFDAVRHDAYFWAIMFIVLAAGMLVTYTGQGVTFASCSEHLMHRLREQVFRYMLRQDISFFDKDENSAGSLTSFLFSDTFAVAGLSGATLGTILLTCSTLVSSVILAVCIGWELTLVCVATIPVLLGCGFFRFYLLMQFQENAKEAYANSASFASEAVSAIRTVAALTREEDVLNTYRSTIEVQQARNLKSTLTSSIVYAASQGAIFLCFGLGFWYGGRLMLKGKYDLFQFFVCFTSVIYGAQSAGTIFSFAPDMGKAHASATAIKKLFDRVPTIDAWSQNGQRFNKASVKGHVEFRDVHFRYPTRPEQPILRGLDLTVKPGQYVALVGASGCGKSTTVGLLERFYDPIGGGVFVDGMNIADLHINDYRSVLALVSQEPTLYQGTVKDNILLGVESDVSDEVIEKACREANIYDFIISLPDGFNTTVGSKGTLLSGGQKQRIAIARALIRNPKILLLDEATSALDSESEHIVQAALDKAAKGRTTIAIAHRLSTIQKADVIYVFDQGRIVERGSHAQLMRKNGRYAELVNLQSLEAH